jgi:NAD(P)-dependent dehydrogenase (short-subunit alcohol dehydrogenase family)
MFAFMKEGNMKIQDASVLITGGSRGLGRALGAALSSRGARVVLVARNRADLDQAVADIRQRGGEAYGVVADIGKKQDIYPIAGQAAALIGPIDILIQNASTLGTVPLRLLLDTDCEDLERTLETNLVGPFRLGIVIAGSMALRGHGLVIHITSDAAVEAYPGWGAYGISKAALDHMTRIFSAELRDTGVQFLSIDPGEMDTEMHADAIPDADRSALARPDEVARRILEIIDRAVEIPNGHRLSLSGIEELR